MPNSIERDVYVLRDTLKNPISYVRGTDLLPIILHFRDFTIPSTADARVFVAKPDGNAVYGNAAINGNDVTVSIQQQMFLVLGTTLMQLEILDGNETLLTFSQPVIVEPNLKARDFPESITEIKFLDDAIEQAQEAANNASKAVENANNAIETANAAISSANNAAQNANNTAQELLDRAEQGEFDGPQGPSGTITVGTVKTVQPEQNAAVKNIGTPNNAVFDFEIPRGADGMTDLVARYEDVSEYTATPTSDAPIVINDLNGKTQQTQTNGYQLFDASKLPSKTQGGATVTNNGDGSFTISGSGNLTERFVGDNTYVDMPFTLKEGKLYLSCENVVYPTAYVDFAGDYGFVTSISIPRGSKKAEITITSEEASKINKIKCTFVGNADLSIVGGTIKPMLFQDGDGTWEPFSGGVASPSPDWEQKVHGVGDMGYFDGILQKGYYNTNGVYTSADNYVCTVNKIECKQSDNINVELETSATSIIVSFFQSSGTFISQQTGSGTSLTAAAPANVGYCMISINRASIEPQTAGHICVKVNGKYASGVESHGVNLFDASKLPSNSGNGVDVTNNGDGSFTIGGQDTSSGDFIIYHTLSHEETIKLLKAGTVKINQELSKYPYYGITASYDSKGQGLFEINSAQSNKQSYEITQEMLDNPEFRIRYFIYMGSGFTISKRTIKPMLYQDGDGTWQPYRHTSIQFPLTNPLYDGDKICYVKPGESYINSEGDTVVADKMLYGVYRENAKVVFDGSEDEHWVTLDYVNYIDIKDSENLTTKTSRAVCNKYSLVTYSNSANEPSQLNKFDVRFSQIRFNSNGIYTTSELWKAFLQSNNLEVVYKLAQPWFEPFEDQTPFYNLRSFDDLTYIYSDDSLNPILTVDVAKNQTGGYLLESYAQAQKNAIAEANSQSRLSAIEQQLVNQATAPTE